ncbi:MAG: M48 family metallopeptidase [Thermodesulfobacteriota bacterium]
MLDFFERQEAARRATFFLFFLFLAAVVVIIAIVHWCVTLFLLFTPRYAMTAPSFGSLLRDPDIARVTVSSVLLLVFIGNAYKFFTLRHGGSDIALRLGGRLVVPDTKDHREQRLLHVVEEMALASGLPVPLVYVLDRESGINAFAAGFTPADAVIAVTDGALDLLNRDELQGVVAHEFSHIANGDMRLNLRLIGMVHGILLLHLTGAVILRGMENSLFKKQQGNGALFMAVGFLLYLLGFIGGLAAKMIKAAIARQREYLSDASAVEFTRNPLGLAGALKKIGGLTLGSRLRHPLAEEASHMYFGNGMEDGFSIFATHPSLTKRITLLDPAFDGIFPKINRRITEIPVAAAPAANSSASAFTASPPQSLAPDPAAPAVSSTIEQPATPSDKAISHHMQERRDILRALPAQIRQACRTSIGARAMIIALLFSPDEEIRSGQWQVIRQMPELELVRETERLFPLLRDLPRIARLPLIDLALPALRLLDDTAYRQLKGMTESLIMADQRIDLFEYLVQRLLLRNLARNFPLAAAAGSADRSAGKNIAWACSVLFSILAAHGHADEEEARTSVEEMISQMTGKEKREITFLANARQLPLSDLDRALTILAHTGLSRRRQILDLCLHCISRDGRITAVEAELLRAIGAVLDCPLPPALLAC